jgi:glycosyltransferase involved in cell wall biosynthesis
MGETKKRRSVLMVIERFFPLTGGAETQCFQLSAAFVISGVKVSIVTKRWLKEFAKKKFFKEGFWVFRVGKPGSGRFYDYYAGFSLAVFILKNRKLFDVFYINGGLANVFGSTAIFLGKLLGKKVVAKIETPGELFFSGPNSLSPKRYVHPLIKARLKIVKMADIFISQTRETRKQLLEFGIKEEKIREITNSVDVNFFRPPVSLRERNRLRKKWKVPFDKVVVLFCGRLVKRKG